MAVFVSTLGLGIIDYKIGSGFSISLFYIFPVALAGWALGTYEGIFVSLVCAFIWEATDLPTAENFTILISLSNAFAHLAFLLVISLLLSETHTLLKNEARLSRIDFLTGISNRRALFESASTEMKRLDRTGRPFTLLYMDLDDFKIVNDTGGHEAGNSLLTEVAATLKLQLRGIDIIARVGGDEFAAILPETDEQAAHKVTSRLQCSLLKEMQKHHWPVTFSIGALTCTSAPPNTNEMFRLADQLMYSAKKAGKNTTSYQVYSG